LFWGLVWGVVVVLSIIGGLSGYFYLLPRLQIDPASGYERVNDPMEVALSFTNNGYLPIRPFKVIAFIYDWRLVDGSFIVDIAYDYLGGGIIKRGDTVDFIPKPPVVYGGRKVASADFLVIIQYYQAGWHWPLEKRIRFKAKRGEDGLWTWYRPYLSEKDRNLKIGPKDITHLMYVPKEPTDDNRQ
jgi:hypothetical protein